MEQALNFIGTAASNFWGLFWHLTTSGKVAMILCLLGAWTAINWALIVVQWLGKRIAIWQAKEPTPKM